MKLGRPRFKLEKKIIVAYLRATFTFILLSINAVLAVFLFILSFGFLSRFIYRYVSPFFCSLILFGLGVKLKIPKEEEYPKEKVLYVFNHNSYLDIFVILALRIPGTQYIISKATNNVIPLFLANLAHKAHFIPTRRFRKERQHFFQKLLQDFKASKYSLIASPEGTHRFQHYIAPFNKGIFELGMNSKVNILPLFFNVKKENNPFEGFIFQSGEFIVETMPMIRTEDWNESNLDEKIAEVRSVFTRKFNLEHGEGII